MHINLTRNCRVCVGIVSVYCAHACQALQRRSELTNNTLRKQRKMGYISLPSILNAIIDITSCYCVILKIVILHDAIKAIQNGLFCFPKQRTKSCFFSKNSKNVFFLKKNRFGSVLLKKTGFFPSLSQTLSNVLQTFM